MTDVKMPLLSRKDKRKASQAFTDWAMKTLEKIAPRKLRKDELYNTLSMSCNKETDLYLSRVLEPVIYINYSPKVDNTVPNKIIRIDENDIFVSLQK